MRRFILSFIVLFTILGTSHAYTHIRTVNGLDMTLTVSLPQTNGVSGPSNLRITIPSQNGTRYQPTQETVTNGVYSITSNLTSIWATPVSSFKPWKLYTVIVGESTAGSKNAKIYEYELSKLIASDKATLSVFNVIPSSMMSNVSVAIVDAGVNIENIPFMSDITTRTFTPDTKKAFTVVATGKHMGKNYTANSTMIFSPNSLYTYYVFFDGEDFSVELDIDNAPGNSHPASVRTLNVKSDAVTVNTTVLSFQQSTHFVQIPSAMDFNIKYTGNSYDNNVTVNLVGDYKYTIVLADQYNNLGSWYYLFSDLLEINEEDKGVTDIFNLAIPYDMKEAVNLTISPMGFPGTSTAGPSIVMPFDYLQLYQMPFENLSHVFTASVGNKTIGMPLNINNFDENFGYYVFLAGNSKTGYFWVTLKEGYTYPGGLTLGALVAIVIGSILGGLLIVSVLIFIVKRSSAESVEVL